MSAFIVNDKTITAIVTALQVKDFSSSLTDPDTGEEYNARTTKGWANSFESKLSQCKLSL